MPRTSVALTQDVWTNLGTGVMIITIEHDGSSGSLLLNETNADAAALVVSRGRFGDQFAQNSDAETTWAKGTGPGWILTVDQ